MCGQAIHEWWHSGWASQLASLERSNSLVKHELRVSGARPFVCSSRLPDRILTHASHNVEAHSFQTPKANVTSVRAALGLLGISTLMTRHIAAEWLVAAMDADGDHLVSTVELDMDAKRLCRLYARILARGTTATAITYALSLPAPYGFPPAAFLAALESEASLSLPWGPRVHELATATETLKPEEILELAEAYIRMVPRAVLQAVEPKRTIHDEL